MTDIKPDLKIKLETSEQLKTAWDALKRIGYKANSIPPEGALYIYAYSTGHLVIDFPTQDRVVEWIVSAEEHFEAHVSRKVTLDELLDIEHSLAEAKSARQHQAVIRELPLFEQSITRMGGHLQSIQWDHELGTYRVKDSILQTLEDDLKELQNSHAALMTSNFYIWLASSETRSLANGYYIVPMQPTQEMIDRAKQEFKVDEDEYEELYGESLEDHIVFAHQAMVQAYQQSVQQ